MACRSCLPGTTRALGRRVRSFACAFEPRVSQSSGRRSAPSKSWPEPKGGAGEGDAGGGGGDGGGGSSGSGDVGGGAEPEETAAAWVMTGG